MILSLGSATMVSWYQLRQPISFSMTFGSLLLEHRSVYMLYLLLDQSSNWQTVMLWTVASVPLPQIPWDAVSLKFLNDPFKNHI